MTCDPLFIFRMWVFKSDVTVRVTLCSRCCVCWRDAILEFIFSINRFYFRTRRMGGACSTHGWELRLRSSLGGPKGRNWPKQLSVDGIYRSQTVPALYYSPLRTDVWGSGGLASPFVISALDEGDTVCMWQDSYGSWWGVVAGFCEHCNEPLDFRRGG